ncbi:MAG: insulinase family protein [Gemmatimonadetes bacterium]|nr:insulinase family protein [Gemmatimonadota bacterium]
MLTDRPAAQVRADGLETTERLDQEVRRSVLPSGAVILSERMDSVRSVAAGVWVRRGTAHEQPEYRGIAHLLEHMVFKGTGRRTAQEIASDVEGTGGSLDAYTTHEHTSFQVRVPADHLGTGLDVLTDLAFSPALRADDLELEKAVVLEEISRTEDTPDDQVFELHSEFLYDGHPYGAPILGTRETVESIGADALRQMHREAYRPGNMVVAVAGQVDHDDLLRHVRDLWPVGEEHRAEENVPCLEKTAVGSRVTRRPGGRQVHLIAGGRGMNHSNPLRHAAALVGQALGGGMSSRLFQKVREQLGLAYSVFSFQAFYARAGHLGAYLATSPETAGDARDVLLDELRSLAERGISSAELEDVKEQIKGQILLSLESPAARMHRLAGMVLYEEPYRDLDALVDLIEAVDLDQAAEVSRLYDPEGLAVLELWPA